MNTAKNLRIVYMGTPDFAVEALRRLVEGGYNVVGVVTMPDKPSGRGLKIQYSAVKQYALEAGLSLLQPEKLKAQEFIDQLTELQPDLGVVIAFRMLPEVVWALPKMGTINLHASLLPQYRGAAPINHALINGESKTGVTTFFLNHTIDTGDILMQKETAISDDDTLETLHDRLMVMGGDAVIESVEMIAKGEYSLTRQNHIPESELKAAPKIFREDCHLNWALDAVRVRNQVRGLSPYPAAWSTLHIGEQEFQLKIFDVSIVDEQKVGTAGSAVLDKTITVQCCKGAIRINRLQPAGKRQMSSEEFLRGIKISGESHFE
jgi:methionyl-tRNA formyltransferase